MDREHYSVVKIGLYEGNKEGIGMALLIASDTRYSNGWSMRVHWRSEHIHQHEYNPLNEPGFLLFIGPTDTWKQSLSGTNLHLKYIYLRS